LRVLQIIFGEITKTGGGPPLKDSDVLAETIPLEAVECGLGLGLVAGLQADGLFRAYSM
jgi:hypothetical protein